MLVKFACARERPHTTVCQIFLRQGLSEVSGLLINILEQRKSGHLFFFFALEIFGFPSFLRLLKRSLRYHHHRLAVVIPSPFLVLVPPQQQPIPDILPLIHPDPTLLFGFAPPARTSTMEPALPLPLRLDLSYSTPTTLAHDDVAERISDFLASYAARTGTSNAASGTDEAASSTTTGGVVAAQLTRLTNGLRGKIDYDAFTALLQPSTEVDQEVDLTPVHSLQQEQSFDQGHGQGNESFSKTDELIHSQTPTLDRSLISDPIDSSLVTEKREKKDKKLKKDKKEKKSLKSE